MLISAVLIVATAAAVGSTKPPQLELTITNHRFNIPDVLGKDKYAAGTAYGCGSFSLSNPHSVTLCLRRSTASVFTMGNARSAGVRDGILWEQFVADASVCVPPGEARIVSQFVTRHQLSPELAALYNAKHVSGQMVYFNEYEVEVAAEGNAQKRTYTVPGKAVVELAHDTTGALKQTCI